MAALCPRGDERQGLAQNTEQAYDEGNLSHKPMQQPHRYRIAFEPIRDTRLIAFAEDRPPESQSVPVAKLKPERLSTPADVEIRQEQRRQQRNERVRREAWERYSEEMTDEQLLQTLGELHVKAEDEWARFQKTHPTRESELYEKLDRQVQHIEEQLAGAREVWADRRHAKHSNDQLKKEVIDLQTQCLTARERLDQFPTTSARYAEERLKVAIIEEQTHIAESVPRRQ